MIYAIWERKEGRKNINHFTCDNIISRIPLGLVMSLDLYFLLWIGLE
jgi:hypothetical protein